MSVPQMPKSVPIAMPDGRQTQEEEAYRKKMEAVVRDLLARVEALETP